MKRNPIEISDFIKDEFGEYISSTYVIDNEDYQDQLRNELRSVDLFNGPFLHTVLPFEKSESINELVSDGTLSKEFLKLDNTDVNRKLYCHQAEAIRKASEGHSLVITTGTGSGKTESFLYPILNYIMHLIEKGNKPRGVKAIFLYPMNALVNDQRDRLREMLRDYPEITFGSFTGDTPEKRDKEALQQFEDEGIIPPENELISREEIRHNPPDLLFTNYSMLEYLLIRPADYSIFSPENMKAWQFMVLDEAHTYKGTLGIEISMLLKRLTGMVNRVPQFILTSATLGDKNDVPDIIRFAENLTPAHFRQEDIIFGKRHPLDKNAAEYSIDPSRYVQLKSNLTDIDKIRKIAEEYTDASSENSVESTLYSLLKKDKNTYLLYDAIHGTNIYESVKEELNKQIKISDDQLVALIHLISFANKEGSFLYDAKFHMFISTPNRAFITLGKNKKIKFGNHITIDDQKAFEIGTCRNCNHMYIMGNINNGSLEPNDSIDVYENYDEEHEGKVDFFTLDPQEEQDDDELYYVCAKCGHIYKQSNLNAETCDCDEEYRVPLYHVNNDGSEKKNNLTNCVYCGQSNTSGIINSFHMNKDTATSVLARIFYEGMGDPVKIEENKQPVGFDDLFSLEDKKEQPNKDVKQLLAFSDSRQQASFFSVFFNYNHERILRRRIVWQTIEDQDQMSVRSLATILTSQIKEQHLFDSEITKSESEAWISILVDLLKVDGQHSSDGIALYTYNFDIKDQLKKIQSSAVAISQRFGLTTDEFITLLEITFDRFRKDNAINYDIANLTVQEKKDAFQFASQEKYFQEKKTSNSKSYESKLINSFLPVRESGINTTLDYLMRITGADRNKSIEIAKMLWAFMVNTNILTSKKIDNSDGYQLNAEGFNVRPYTKDKWFICNRCKKITRFNIRNVCPEKECRGTLEPCNPDEVLKNNYYRREFMSDSIERIVVKEHTAQLSREKAREYQKEFKEKKINILSSSTTFEMGVDIGSLENVFLRNVPPTPANYVQRAGRAGRSKDSAALVVTYCGNNSHDYTYFNHPVELINGRINPPQFNVSNEKIVLRHILASAFGFYFRKHPEMYRSIDDLIFEDQLHGFKNYISSKPEDLGDYIDNKLLKPVKLTQLMNFQWVNEVLQDDSKLNRFVDELVQKLETYEKAIQDATVLKDYTTAGVFQNNIKRIKQKNVLDTLSEYAIIPKYGFPVDVVNLDVMGDVGKNKDLNLQRDLSVAISEYAPDSEIIVDGNKYVSRYINLPKVGSLTCYYYYECGYCGHVGTSLVPLDESTKCENCGFPIGSIKQYFLEPDMGFSTDRNAKHSKNTRPLKTYAGKIKYLGGGTEDENVFNYHDILTITPVSKDQMLVLNEYPFYYCPQCGYTKLYKNKFQLQFTERSNHRDRYGRQCENKVLERTALGHIFVTDVVKIRLNMDEGSDELVTFAYALTEGMSHALQIERTDINGMVIQNEMGEYDIVLYDNVPGGAGHVKRLADEKTMTEVLKAAYNVVNQNCCDENTTCYKCLRNYYNQADHNRMKRKYARDIIANILSAIA